MRLFILLSVVLFSGLVFSQTNVTFPEVTAEFPGGREAMVSYLQNNLEIPVTIPKRHLKDKCYVKFVVSETGNVSNVQLVKGMEKCPECDKEAVRVVKAMPDWTPALLDGKPINAWYTLPISFHYVK